MKRFMMVVAGVLMLAGPAFAGQAKSAEKTMSAAGTVSAVTADSITVKGKDAEWTFAVDKSTHVSAPGASHKSATAKADKTPMAITEYVKVGDRVSVKYHDMGAMKHAADVRVQSAAPAAKKK